MSTLRELWGYENFTRELHSKGTDIISGSTKWTAWIQDGSW